VNPPIAIPAIALLFWVWPNDPPRGAHLAQIKLNQIDWIGVALLLLFTTLFTFSVQQAGTRVFSWNSPIIIAFLTVAIIALAALLLWSWMIPRVKSLRHVAEVLPWRVLTDRILLSAIVYVIIIEHGRYCVLTHTG
jgi:protein-S-isoprenylcysteine O-methyltransferase Ste14